MFAILPDIESHIDALIASSQYNDAIVNILVGVNNHMNLPSAARNFLYYPNFDRQMQNLSDALVAELQPTTQNNLTDNTLIIASEMYPVGGHSRVIADIVREVPSPIIVLTDMFWTFRTTPNRLNWLIESMGDTTIIVLPQLTPWAKCQGLYRLTQQLQPSNILYFNHHQDPIPFVGTLGHKGSRKTLVHHCDHSPSLGNTLNGVQHVDFVKEMAKTCAQHLGKDTFMLPLHVQDRGKKDFPPITGSNFSAVTSGTHIKFARTGEMSLQNIAQTVLSCIQGNFFHIGEIDHEWVAEIKSYVASVGLEPDRFVPLGQVPSVWNTLANLDAHIYIGSAPKGGGRAAIEAQGCGYPLLFFRVDDQGPALGSDSLYASKQLGWSTLAELSTLLVEVGIQHKALSLAARALYEQHYSRDEFTRVLKEILIPGTVIA